MSEFTLEERVLLRTYCPAERSKRKRGDDDRAGKRKAAKSAAASASTTAATSAEVMSADMLRLYGALDAVRLLPDNFYAALKRLKLPGSQGAWISRRDGGTPARSQPLSLELSGASSSPGGKDTLVLWLTMPSYGDRFALNVSSDEDDSKFVIWHYRQAIKVRRG